VLTGAGAAACGRRRGSHFPGYAFVANEDGRAVAVVNLSAFAVVRHIPLAAEPTELIAHTTRPVVYALTPRDGHVHEIGTDTMRAKRNLRVGSSALTMRLAPTRDALWLLTAQPNQLVRVGLDSLHVEARIPLPFEPVDLDLSLESPLAAVSYGASGSAGIVDLMARRAGPPSPAGSAVRAVRFRKDGKQLILAHAADRLLTVLDVATGRVVVRLPLAMRPDNLCFKADGGQLFVTGEGQDAVAIVFPYATQVFETVLAGHAPGSMGVSPGGGPSAEYLFVSNPQSGQVTILNIAARKVLASAQVGAEPGAILITPDNQYALVLNRRSGDMAVLLIQAAARRTRFPAALFTIIPVGSKPVSAVVRAV
jgi:DNA-binding beta-propeller fold protein YncE